MVSLLSSFSLLSAGRIVIQSSNVANDIFAVEIISLAIFLLMLIFNKEINFHIVQGVLVGHLISFIILSSTLVNFDRSRSVQVLLWVVSNEGVGLQKEDVSMLALINYESEMAMLQRLDELKSIRLITTSKGKWYPTTFGRVTYKLAEFSSSLFKLSNFTSMLKLSKL